MDFNRDTVTDVVRRFVVRERGVPHQKITPDTELLRAGLLDSFNLVVLTQEISKEFERAIPQGTLMPEDFDTPTALWSRLNDLWGESAS